MKKIIALLTFSLLVFSFSIYQSCKPQQKQCIILNKMIMSAINKNTGQPVQMMDSVSAANLSLSITLDTREFSCMHSAPFSWINAAYADKNTAIYLYYDTLKKVTITCLQNFDSTHAAGSSLNSYFNVPPLIQHTNEFVKQYSFQLQATPDSQTLYEFRIIAELSSGALYDTVLPPLKILL